jgi:hypothetical protein
MKAAKVILAIIAGIIVLSLAWGLVSAAIGLVVELIRGIFGLMIGVAIIGGLGWVILRLIGRKPLAGSRHESLP